MLKDVNRTASLVRGFETNEKFIPPNRWRFPSPFEDYPGHVDLPRTLTAEQYDKWYRLTNDPEFQGRLDDNLHWALAAWEGRHEWVIDWQLKNLESSQITADGLKIPDMRLLVWFMSVSQKVLEEATMLPNWPGPSSED